MPEVELDEVARAAHGRDKDDLSLLMATTVISSVNYVIYAGIAAYLALELFYRTDLDLLRTIIAGSAHLAKKLANLDHLRVVRRDDTYVIVP